jgi:hypothetical protein
MSRRVRAVLQALVGWRAVAATAAMTAMCVASVPMVFEATVEGAQAPAAPVTTTTAPAGASPSDNWTPSRTLWGDPDLEGIYTSSTYTPLERPTELSGKEFFTEEEAAAYAQRRHDGLVQQSRDDIHYDDAVWQSETTRRSLSSLRTSMVVDPPDGRIPPLTPEAQQRVTARAAARRGNQADSAKSRVLSERCITQWHEGPPMLVPNYFAMYQIVQAPGYVTILQERSHGVRVIPLDGREHLSPHFRQYYGESRGRWEGDTLVVEVTNFNDQTDFRGPANIRSEKLSLVERFTRVDKDTILYQFTVEDPGTWTRPWSAELPLMATEGPLFEYACHEGNYGLANILSAARAAEAAEEAERNAARPTRSIQDSDRR